ncbi:ABC transporter ATP-binding protein [Actinoplanes sp. RD1]|uniref:ABC transporter ATP-binding protein n=1 Tax=Actinoplanes sp. RD1 TaxID=3064538 RepID=UPI002741D632|nr:ABC transporter ATP-binding protein [Actinoplanes sp. RD1]
MTALLQVQDLTVEFPTEDGVLAAVRGVSYEVGRGESVGIVGESGSGKSVTSLAVMGLLPRNARVSGSVRLLGEELLSRTDAELSKIRGRNVAMIFQDPLTSLNPVHTVGAQIAEAVLAHRDVPKQKAMRRATELLEIVGIPFPELRARNYPHELSGGMRQRIVIAIAMANDPELIIADEPTTALDVTVQAQVLEALEAARRETGASLVLITHDLGVIAGHTDRVNVMYAGKLVETGTVDEIFHRPRMPYTLGLLSSLPRIDESGRQRLTPIAGSPPSLLTLPAGCPFAPRCPMAQPICSTAEPPLLRVAPTHAAACHFHDSVQPFPVPETPASVAPRASDPILSVRGLVKHFPVRSRGVVRRRIGDVHAVCDVSFDILAHETLGLVGESGCGKTTTGRVLLNLEPATAGSVHFQGRDLVPLSRARMRPLRKELQIVFQDPYASLDPRMTVNEIIAEPLRIHGRYGSDGRAQVRSLLRTVGLDIEHGNRYAHEFSGGQRQRIGIARALALRPKVLVLDEPVSALDVSIQAGVVNLLEDLQDELGLSYLFISHDLSVVRHIADRVAVMYLGRIVETAPVEELFRKAAHPYTQALISAIPVPDPHKERARERIILTGDVPSPVAPPSGCRFRTRCPKFPGLTEREQRACVSDVPPLVDHGEGHRTACHYAEALTLI